MAKVNLKFYRWLNKKGKPVWTARHLNGNIIADGSEDYSSVAKRNNGMLSLITSITDGKYEIVDGPPPPKKKAVKKATASPAV